MDMPRLAGEALDEANLGGVISLVQRQVADLGEINDSQRAAWCRTIEVVEGKSGSRQMALFPEGREVPALECEVVRVQVQNVEVHEPRQWGACWLALCLWDRLELDRFWRYRLPETAAGVLIRSRAEPMRESRQRGGRRIYMSACTLDHAPPQRER